MSKCEFIGATELQKEFKLKKHAAYTLITELMLEMHEQGYYVLGIDRDGNIKKGGVKKIPRAYVEQRLGIK
ncbi:MAG: hypothetical protein ACRCWQ_10580 [Bacilli bacterium]